MSPSARMASRIAALPDTIPFARFPIDKRTIFYLSESSFAFTNLKPVIPGHVLVSPLRVVDRLTALSDSEVRDLFAAAKAVGDVILRAHPQADSLTFTVQDGPSAGQTVPHVHVHIMPRWASDRFNSCRQGNDAVYEAVNASERDRNCEMERMDAAAGIPDRSREEMIEEAQSLRDVVHQIIAN
jgi:bis(5'-adenosyl)-triphosphatase